MSEKKVRKSIRLSPTQAKELARLSTQTALPESVLLKKWILEGIRAEKMDLAVEAYMKRRTDLRGGAAMAEVSYDRFMHEVESRNLVILDDDHMLESLSFLADTFHDAILKNAIRKVLQESSGEPKTS
jgi:hypothetical protein